MSILTFMLMTGHSLGSMDGRPMGGGIMMTAPSTSMPVAPTPGPHQYYRLIRSIITHWIASRKNLGRFTTCCGI